MFSVSELKRSFSVVMQSGQGFVLALTAVLMPLLILIAAFAVDVSLALAEQSRLQSAADHAARTAGLLRGANQTAGQITNGAYAVAAANGYVNGSNATVTVNIPPTSGNFINYSAAVEVIITETKPTLFASILSKSSLGQKARAVGDWDYAPCLVALGTGATGANVGVSNGGSFTFTAGCGVYSNSQSTRASLKAPSGVIRANGFFIADQGGTVDGANLQSVAGTPMGVTLNAPYFPYPDGLSAISSQLNSGVPTGTGSPAITGPTTSCSYPDNNSTSKTYGQCCNSNSSCKTPVGTWLDTATMTVSPSYYYDTFPVPSGGTTYKLASGGIYYTNNFQLTSTGAVVDGTAGATLAIVGKSAQFSISGGAALNINSPSVAQNSTFAGIAIIGGTTNITSSVSFTGGSGSADGGINGIIALPSANVQVAGGSSTSTTCQTYFASSISISGSGGIGSGCNSTISNMSAFRAKNLVE